MCLTQKLTPMPGMDPMQKKMMQFMPLVFGVMLAFFPAGLVLYWVTNGLLGLAAAVVDDQAPRPENGGGRQVGDAAIASKARFGGPFLFAADDRNLDGQRRPADAASRRQRHHRRHRHRARRRVASASCACPDRGRAAIAETITRQAACRRGGRVHARFRDGDGEVIDDGIAMYFAAPALLHRRGRGRIAGARQPGAAATSCCARCIALGARMARPGEFTERAFLNGKLDLAQAEAVADLISAGSEAAARAARRSLDGEFSRRVDALAEQLTQCACTSRRRSISPTRTSTSSAAPELRKRLADGARVARRSCCATPNAASG